jgi:hypothetical protein
LALEQLPVFRSVGAADGAVFAVEPVLTFAVALSTIALLGSRGLHPHGWN